MSIEQFVYSAVVTDVHDGDTITADVDLGFGIWIRNQKFRLAKINAPELRGERREEGMAARDFLYAKIQSADFKIRIKTEKDKKEKYGRFLAHLYVNLLCLNDLLVAKGYAEYKDY